MRRLFLLLLAFSCGLIVPQSSYSAQITGTPAASGPGQGSAIIFEPIEFSPTAGFWILSLDFAFLDPIAVSFATDSSSSDFVYNVQPTYTNSTGQAWDAISVELIGGDGTVSLSDSFYNNTSSAGNQINPSLFEFDSIGLLDNASSSSSFNLNLGSDAVNQTDFQLVFAPIPEPSTAVVLSAAAMALLMRRGRSPVC